MAQAYVNTLSRDIISTAYVADRDLTAAVEDVQGTEHVGQPTGREYVSTRDDESPESRSHLPHLLLQPDAPNDAPTVADDARVLLDAAVTALHGVAAGSPPVTPVTRIRHGATAINEYTSFSFICEGAFIWQFPLGCPYATVPTHAELRHLFMQADNRASDDDEFAMYMWNVRARADVCSGVVRGWRTNPHLFRQIEQLANDPTILEQLRRATADPTSPEAQRLLNQLRPVLLATSSRVQYGNSGANSAAFSKVVAQHRVAGNGALFVTVNPRLHEELLPLRFTMPIASNFGNLDTLLPAQAILSNSARKAQLIDHPIGLSLGFMFFKDALFRHLLRLPLTSQLTLTRLNGPHDSSAPRGILGALKIGTVAVESSASGLPHLHLEGTPALLDDGTHALSLVAHSVTSDFVSGIVHDPEQNQQLSNYWQSIITSFLPDDATGWQADLTGEPWILGDTRPSATESPREYQLYFCGLCRRYQDHKFPEFHNFSCFKESAPGGVVDLAPANQGSLASAREATATDSALATLRNSAGSRVATKGHKRLKEALCRFIRPVPAFSFGARYVQLVMLELQNPSSQGPRYTVRALRGVEAPPLGDAWSLIRRETRCLEFQHARPAVTASLPSLPDDASYYPLEDGQDPNCWFVECSAPITVGTGAHNNIQQLDGRDLGAAAYMSKYLVKNNLKPEKSLSILYEALQHVAKYPSVAAAAESATPSARRIIHIVERVLNSTRGAIELSMPLILGSLLGMRQFETSHSFRSVFLADAVEYVRQHNRVGAAADAEVAEPSALGDDDRDDVDEVGVEAGENDYDEAQADLTRDSNGRLRFVSQKTDYAYRDARLADWNLAEFSTTFYKVPNAPSDRNGEEGAEPMLGSVSTS